MRPEHASVVVEEFASLISKELEQPLRTAITALSQIDGQLPATDDPVRRLLRVAIRNLGHATFVLEQANAFADLGSLQLHREPARVREVLIEVSQDVSLGVGSPLSVSCPSDLVVEVDLVWIKQILNDLVGAAISSRRSGASLSLVAARGLEPSEVVIRSAWSWGESASPEREEPHNAERRARWATEGVLSICKAVVRSHGGSFWSRTDTDGNFSFCITLPESLAFARHLRAL